jgi:GT2 family glycosyltransferase
MSEITIVIPNYNGMKYLPDCLRALENQESETPDFTVLVVDNGSTDGSVQELSENWPKVNTVFLPENTGFCHAVNVGIEAAETPYVILLNNDTKVMPGFVKALYKAIQKDKKIFSVSSCMLMWDNPKLVDDARP